MMTQEDRDEKLKQVQDLGKHAQGKKEYIKFLEGKHLTLSRMILANCYECNGYYADGKEDCECDSCVFYAINPYNPNKVGIRAPSDVPRKGPVRPKADSVGHENGF